MKKQQHLFLAVFAIAAMAGICSCSNDDELAAGQGKSIHVFTATMEGNPATRATFNSTGKYAEWEVNDEININGKSYKAKSAGAATSFVATDGDAEGETFTAYFPASLYNEGTPTLPSAISETYVAGRFNMPMYATSNNNELEFKNLCGVIAVTVNNDVIETVKKITVSSSDKAISGAFTVTENAAELTEPSETANTLTVTYNESVIIDETDGNVFYIPVPAQTYTNLTIVLDADGTGTTTSCIIVKDGTATVERSKLYSVEFEVTAFGKGTEKATINSVETDVNWVQLWEGGPKFADHNIGATSATDCGGYYCWGKSIDKDPNLVYNEEDEVLSGDDDTATKLWGSNWRMPTIAELTDLSNNCSWTWYDGEEKKYKNTNVKGCLVAGKGDYKGNSVFLPAAGYWDYGNVYDQGIIGYYWSSTPVPDGHHAHDLHFISTGQDVGLDVGQNIFYDRNRGYSVRAVLAE